jgi:hypothetical protein
MRIANDALNQKHAGGAAVPSQTRSAGILSTGKR